MLLLTSRLPAGQAVRARIRVGAVVAVRVPGVVRHRLVLGRLARIRSGFTLGLRNGGNVEEWVGSRRVTLTLARRGRRVAVLHPVARRFLAGGSGLLTFRMRRLSRIVGHGSAGAVVEVAVPGVNRLRRRYRLQL